MGCFDRRTDGGTDGWRDHSERVARILLSDMSGGGEKGKAETEFDDLKEGKRMRTLIWNRISLQIHQGQTSQKGEGDPAYWLPPVVEVNKPFPRKDYFWFAYRQNNSIILSCYSCYVL